MHTLRLDVGRGSTWASGRSVPAPSPPRLSPVARPMRPKLPEQKDTVLAGSAVGHPAAPTRAVRPGGESKITPAMPPPTWAAQSADGALW